MQILRKNEDLTWNSWFCSVIGIVSHLSFNEVKNNQDTEIDNPAVINKEQIVLIISKQTD